MPSRPPAGDPVPENLRLLNTTMAVQLAHRDKLTAGVPGCTCGRKYPDDSHGRYPLLHARHVADEVIRHVLDAAVAAIISGRDASDPSEWCAVQDSTAALDAITSLVRRPGADLTKEKLTV